MRFSHPLNFAGTNNCDCHVFLVNRTHINDSAISLPTRACEFEYSEMKYCCRHLLNGPVILPVAEHATV